MRIARRLVVQRDRTRAWAGQRPFDDPIPLPRGRQLVTLRDAAEFIQKFPKTEQDLDEWQAAKKDACEPTDNKLAPSKQSREAERRRIVEKYVTDLREIIKKLRRLFS